MNAPLASYAAGSWRSPEAEGEPILDAATGEEVARLASSGPDPTAMWRYAREVGGPAIREATFPERAGLLKQVALHLKENADELYALSTHTGATRRDSAIDIDGGIGTMLALASTARRELPADTVILDGEPEILGRGGDFVGQHLYASRRGVQLQINAFNFGVWGMLEKLAPAFLAGLPSFVKPAGQTAYLTQAAVRLIVESGLLPEGSLQLLCTEASALSPLFATMDEQDSIAFTGSAATGARLRTEACVVERGVRLGVEADSLNCSILGPDAAPGTPEFDLFVKAVVTEMTVKAGQKCTAIRRALVPAGQRDAVIEAVAARLEKVTVGDPRHPEVRMGALVGLAQREAVREAVAALRAEAELVHGDPDSVELLEGDPERGAFLAPMLLRADAAAQAPHAVEPFGPVACVIGYDSPDQAVEIAARGRGSLAASVVSHDAGFATAVVRGLAPWHGRVLVLDRDDAAESTGHGTPLPSLIHGGPGRAGGGEELGGMRAVRHQMQRTALQGSPDMVTAIGGRWTPGAHREVTPVHPFRKALDELRIGDTIASAPRTVTEADIADFAAATGDTFYAHTDPEAAAKNPLFGGLVAHGYLVVSLAAGLFVDPAPGPVLANFGVDRLRFLTPVRSGEEISVRLTVKQITPRSSADYGEVRWDAVVSNAAGDPVATYDVLTLVAKTSRPDHR